MKSKSQARPGQSGLKSAKTHGRDGRRPGCKSFPVVGVGASAGGCEAFTRFLEKLPGNTGMAFVLVQHLDRPEILSAPWAARLCELELHLTRLEIENQKLRDACRQLQVSQADQIKFCDATPMGLVTLDLRGVIQNINRTGATLLGLAKKQLLRRRFTFSVSPGDIPKFMAHLRRCLRSRKTVSDELRLRETGANPLLVQLSSAPVLDLRSRVIGFQTTLTDVTARKRVESALQAGEQILRALIEASPHPIRFKDAQARWLLANQAALELFELTHANYRNKRGTELAGLLYRPLLEAEERKDLATMKAGRMSRRDETIPKPDGSTRILDVIRVPLLNPHGRCKGLVVLGYDLTERKKGEEALRQTYDELESRVRERTAELARANAALRTSEARLQAIIDHSPAMIFLKDTQGRYLHFNRQFGQVFNLKLEKIRGKTDAEIFPPKQAALFQINDRQVIKTGKAIQFDETVDCDGGSRVSIVTKFPLFGEDGKIYAIGGIVADITERRRLEAEVLQISEREQRRISQDLHDGLGQQLAGISCLSDTLKKDLAEKAPAQAATAARISQLLDLSVSLTRALARGLQPVIPESRGLVSAFEDLAAHVTDLFKVSCRFDCSQPALIEDNAAATHLYRIAQEAVTNSIKHGRAQQIKISLSSTSERIVLTVSDNGDGFKKPAKPGKGLGMRIMNYRAGMIGGQLDVKEKAGRGVEVFCAVERTGRQPAAVEPERIEEATLPLPLGI